MDDRGVARDELGACNADPLLQTRIDHEAAVLVSGSCGSLWCESLGNADGDDPLAVPGGHYRFDWGRRMMVMGRRGCRC